MKPPYSQRHRYFDMDSNGLKRKDTTKGPPLRILSLGTYIRLSRCSRVFGAPSLRCVAD